MSKKVTFKRIKDFIDEKKLACLSESDIETKKKFVEKYIELFNKYFIHSLDFIVNPKLDKNNINHILESSLFELLLTKIKTTIDQIGIDKKIKAFTYDNCKTTYVTIPNEAFTITSNAPPEDFIKINQLQKAAEKSREKVTEIKLPEESSLVRYPDNEFETHIGIDNRLKELEKKTEPNVNTHSVTNEKVQEPLSLTTVEPKTE